jgi:hypothetical protein
MANLPAGAFVLEVAAIWEKGGAWGRIRTTDTRIFNPLLYQLSYPGLGPVRAGAASIKEPPCEVQRPLASVFQAFDRSDDSGASGSSSSSTGTA